MTFIKIFNVPDLGGFPPSTPVRTNLIVACFSRSKALFSTNSQGPLYSKSISDSTNIILRGQFFH
uniref:Uncharacterized protein n=1 Tax=Sinocyclocheilus rhinocerous TaxID=307959 RepID=A0A673KCT5_9TELE